MARSIKDIVNSALVAAEAEIKVAGLRDTAPRVENDLDVLFNTPTKTASAQPQAPAKVAAETDTRTVLSDAEYGMKLAEALGIAAELTTELVKKAAAMEVLVAGHDEKPTHPKATSTVKGIPSSVRGTEMANSAEDFTSVHDHSDVQKNDPSTKSAHDAVVAAKVAQAEMYRRIGNTAAADRLDAEVKTAAMEGSELDKGPSGSNHVPDAAALISMTRAQARDRNTAELRGVLTEPPKKDPAALAAVTHNDGLKMSAKTSSAKIDPAVGRRYLTKVAAVLHDTTASAGDRQAAAAIINGLKEYAASA